MSDQFEEFWTKVVGDLSSKKVDGEAVKFIAEGAWNHGRLTERQRILAILAQKDQPKAKHPGWVFGDKDGVAWGWDDVWLRRAAGIDASRPFTTRDQAAEAGRRCHYGCATVREWRADDGVPPMPDGMEGVP